MKNRESLYPGRVKLTPVDAASGIYDLVRADEPQEPGTPLNKKLLDFAVAACGVTAGTATAFTLDDEFGGFELVDGAKVNFRLHVESGAGATLNINNTGAKKIVSITGAELANGVIAGTWITAVYSQEPDAYVIQSAGGEISAGEYMGDGTGTVEIAITANKVTVTSSSKIGETPKNIMLPFAPNVLMLFANGIGASAPIYQGGIITGVISARLSASTGTSVTSGNITLSAVPVPLLRLSGNALSLIQKASYKITQRDSTYTKTTISNEAWTSISDQGVSVAGGANNAGQHYSYIIL